MKKIFFTFAVLTLVFTSCNPLEDIYNDLDKKEANNKIVGDVVYTLSDKDYTEAVAKGGLGLKFPNLSSEADAKTKLPAFLSNKFPALGVIWENGKISKASTAKITYNLYNKKYDEKSLKVYTVSSADYTAQGGNVARFKNFSNAGHITTFLNAKYPTPANRVLVSLTYKYYSGSVKTLNNGFIYVNGAWQMVNGITNDEYTAMGEGRAQFSNKEEALTKLPVYLKNKFQYNPKKSGDIEGVMYKLYVTDTQDVDNDGKTNDRTVYSFIVYFIYNGTTWSKYNNVIPQTLQLGHDGTKWVPDNTIKYTLTNADYALVGNGTFNNFDIRAGKGEEKESVRLTKISTILLNNFPSAAEGQKYSVSYNVWKPGNDVFVMNVIKKGAAYILQ